MTTQRRPVALVVDDEDGVRLGLRRFLEANGWAVEQGASAAEAEAVFRAGQPDVVLLDYRLPDAAGLELLERLRSIDADVPVVMLTAHGSIELAVEAIKQGAEQFLTKPIDLAALLVLLQRSVEGRRSRREQAASQARQQRDALDPFLGSSRAMARLAHDAERVAEADTSTLIYGETGSGKGVLARWLHRRGPRSREPFVDLNCAGLSRELLETELFGHEAGAFTGAVRAKEGLFEVAHRGTIFLDEIGDLDPALQPKLLTVLEEKRFRRVGDVRDRRVDVRLVSATHQALEALIRERRFRSDLYFRVSPVILTIPPLRERSQDVPVVAQVLLERLRGELGRPRVELATDAVEALKQHAWPGNIRELRNVLERALLGAGADRGCIRARDLTLNSSAPGRTAPRLDEDGADGDDTLASVQRRQIEKVLQSENGNVARAATRLGISKASLYERLRRLRVDSEAT